MLTHCETLKSRYEKYLKKTKEKGCTEVTTITAAVVIAFIHPPECSKYTGNQMQQVNILTPKGKCKAHSKKATTLEAMDISLTYAGNHTSSAVTTTPEKITEMQCQGEQRIGQKPF